MTSLDKFFILCGVMGTVLIVLHELAALWRAYFYALNYPTRLAQWPNGKWLILTAKDANAMPRDRKTEAFKVRYYNQSLLFHTMWRSFKNVPIEFSNTPYLTVFVIQSAIIWMGGRPLIVAFGASMLTVMLTFGSFALRRWVSFIAAHEKEAEVGMHFYKRWLHSSK